jgi:NADPH-dependent glutamate synthase beta subunit-like oxidoreductase
MPPKFSRELQHPIIFSGYLDDQPRTSPCEADCPAGNPIQKISYLIQERRFEEALEYIRARNPFPGVCGRVCLHPCENKCNRNDYDESVSIKALERAAFDHSEMAKVRRPLPMAKTGKRIAIIGSGPAGMTCAYFLRLFGHSVTIFEALPFLGGMMRSGVPDYRLSKDVLDREIGQILELGIQSKTNTVVGKDVTLTEIMAEYNACLVAVGTWKVRRPEVPGGHLGISGLSFLRQANSGNRPAVGKKVVIVGGGGVALDCAFTARRLGTSEIHIVCLEPGDKMLASPEDLSQARAEGVIFHNSAMISEILSRQEKTTGIEFHPVSSFRFDEAGQLTTVRGSGKMEKLKADTVILAIGEQPDFMCITGDGGFKLTPKGTLEVDSETMATPVAGVFAAGDAVSGPTCVAEAIGAGRRAAIGIHHYVMRHITTQVGYAVVDSQQRITMTAMGPESMALSPRIVRYEELSHIDYFEKIPRVVTQKIAASESMKRFLEIDFGYEREQAVQEAARCFHCGHCFSCGSCVEDCPGYVLTMGSDGPAITYPEECWHCGNCRISCPCGAVEFEFPLSMLV